METYVNVVNEGMLGIGRMYVTQWQKNAAGQEMIIRIIKSTDIAKSVLVFCYCILTSRKQIDTIEQMPADVLDHFESEAQEWEPGITGKKLTRLIKCIHAMGSLLNIYGTQD